MRLGSIFCFGKSEMPAASGRAPEWGGARPLPSAPAPFPWAQRTPAALASLLRCQDTTDWADAEDVPFLWFFCLF